MKVNLDIDLSLNEYLADVARNIADKYIGDTTEYFNVELESFAFGDYYFKYHHNNEDETAVISVSLKEVLTEVMR